jgi:hypothetical protein
MNVLPSTLRARGSALALACLTSLSPAIAANSQEVVWLRSMDTTIITQGLGGSTAANTSDPNTNGLVGGNQGTTAFSPDGQRGGIDDVVVGVARINDTNVANGWRAIEKTYSLQTPAGDFSTQSNSITSTGGGTNACHFFLAWSAHAMLVVLGSDGGSPGTSGNYRYKMAPDMPGIYSGQTYDQRVNALKSKIKQAMIYMIANGQYTLTGQLLNDRDSANRGVINACAFALNRRLLTGSSVVSGTTIIADCDTRAQGWYTNVFVTNNSRTNNPAAPIFRSNDGVFLENPSSSSIKGGYDTSYQAVATRFYQLLTIYGEPSYGNSSTDLARAARAGRWLERRIRIVGTTPTIDCTFNTRTGPNNQSNSTSGNDTQSLAFALLMYDKMNNRSEGTTAAGRCKAGTYSNDDTMSPVVFSASSANVARGASFNVLATNAGQDSFNDGTPATNFQLTASNLPNGVTLGTSIDYRKSTAGKVLSVASNATVGTYTLTFTASNVWGSTSQTFTLTVQ